MAVGIKETKELILGLVSMANAGVEVWKDKRIGLDDLQHALNLVNTLPAAFNGMDQVPAEFFDLDPSETKEIIDAVQVSLKVSRQKAKTIIIKTLTIILGIGELGNEIKRPEVSV